MSDETQIPETLRHLEVMGKLERIEQLLQQLLQPARNMRAQPLIGDLPPLPTGDV